MKKKRTSKKWRFDIPKHLPIITSVFVIILTSTLYFLARGYIIDFESKAVKKRGVITVSPRPTYADIYIDGTTIGKISKSKSVDTGVHNVTIEKAKYHKWSKNVRVLPETTTIVTPWMILQEPQKNTIWNSERKYLKHWVSEDETIALFLLEGKENTLSLWRYRLQNGILDLSDNPREIWIPSADNFELSLSPNGAFALLTITNGNTVTRHIINTSLKFDLTSSQPIDFKQEHIEEIKWAKDNKHILLFSEGNILSYDINSQIIYMMLPSNTEKKHIWDTDQNGNFYLLKDLSKEDDAVYTYSIEQYGLDGTGESYLISNISMQKDEKYIKYYRTTLFNYIPFTNSVINTQTVGKIISFEVNRDAEGVFITTTSASYWYDNVSRTYIMVNPYPSEVVEFSRNHKYFLFNSMDSLYTFTFKKYSENPVEQTGTVQYANATKDNGTRWVDDSRHLSYEKENLLFISEKDGDNGIAVISMENILFYNIVATKNSITTFEKDILGHFVINQYEIQ